MRVESRKPAPRSYDLAAVCAHGRAAEFAGALDLAGASPLALDIEEWRCLHDLAARRAAIAGLGRR